jgi:hypothetical protein
MNIGDKYYKEVQRSGICEHRQSGRQQQISNRVLGVRRQQQSMRHGRRKRYCKSAEGQTQLLCRHGGHLMLRRWMAGPGGTRGVISVLEVLRRCSCHAGTGISYICSYLPYSILGTISSIWADATVYTGTMFPIACVHHIWQERGATRVCPYSRYMASHTYHR